ncbi:dihydropteroate synthase [Senimuribacter intestinalis]|uniref:dihydropteroate synthase n=1 Tax=Senimuribacter intestinalis TaxID=2941507 RepID=UPI0020420078|nr:dihydropteroate synthase [Senimuribacter intestinalis]
MKIGNRDFDFANSCYIMGILNVTPDSFSDGGKWNDLTRAKAHVAQMIDEGADLIDIGGESTRPGHVQISIEEEIRRVVPCIEMVKENFDVPVSIDSYKSQVVEAALKAGADMVNDIWGLKYDVKVAELIAKYDVPCCLMHNREKAEYLDFVKDMILDMKESLAIAEKAGIPKEKIMLDPGVGFGKTYEHNLIAVNRLEELCALGYPVLLATSRKSMIGNALDLPVEERVEGTVATTVMGVMKGAAFVRVHDIKENFRAIQMTLAIMGEGK